MDHPRRPAPAVSKRVDALLALIESTTAVFHGLRALAVEVHGPEAVCVSPGQASGRGVLYELLELGPRSVPEMARRRLVSRQHVQMVVNALLEAGLVDQLENPAHRRSSLIGLTPRGLKVASTMRRRESRLWEAMQLPTTERELRKAAAVLNALRLRISLRNRRDAGRARPRRAAAAGR